MVCVIRWLNLVLLWVWIQLFGLFFGGRKMKFRCLLLVRVFSEFFRVCQVVLWFVLLLLKQKMMWLICFRSLFMWVVVVVVLSVVMVLLMLFWVSVMMFMQFLVMMVVLVLWSVWWVCGKLNSLWFFLKSGVFGEFRYLGLFWLMIWLLKVMMLFFGLMIGIIKWLWKWLQ